MSTQYNRHGLTFDPDESITAMLDRQRRNRQKRARRRLGLTRGRKASRLKATRNAR